MIRTIKITDLDKQGSKIYDYIRQEYTLFDVSRSLQFINFGICGEETLAEGDWLVEIIGDNGNSDLISLSNFVYQNLIVKTNIKVKEFNFE